MNLLTQLLCKPNDPTFWPWRRWPEFGAWPDRERTIVVLPIAGLADWGLGQALDAEEQVLMHLLRAVAQRRPAGLPLLVVPSLQFVVGPSASCAFAVDPTVAHALIDEISVSIAAAGFRRIVLVNASPWNEDLCDATARDLRVSRGLQMFCIHLSALGLDFDPDRGGGGHELSAILSDPSDAALEMPAARLISLLSEIRARPALPANGAIVPAAL